MFPLPKPLASPPLKTLAIAALFLVPLSLGCGDAAEDANSESAPVSDEVPGATAAGDEAAANGEAEGMTPFRDSMQGTWVLKSSTIVRQGNQLIPLEVPIALVEVSKTDGEFTGRVVGSGAQLEDVELEVAQVAEDSIHLRGKSDEGSVHDVRGELKDGRVRGNLLVEGEFQVQPVQLVPTRAESLEAVEPQQAEGGEAFLRALQSQNPSALAEFAEERPSSPLALMAMQMLLGSEPPADATQAEIEARVNDYVQLSGGWGERMERQAKMVSGILLARHEVFPDLAEKFIGEARESFDDERLEAWQSILDDVTQSLRSAKARERLESGDEAARSEASETLREIHADDPGDPRVTYALAEYSSEQDRVDDALRLYAELVALPNLEAQLVGSWPDDGEDRALPSTRLEELWEKKHGNEEGLEEFVDQVYAERIHFFVDEPVAPRADLAGKKTALVELFTGAQCPPCVVADLAVGGLAEAYAQSEVIALRYHEHVPRPDPLTSEASEIRASYYGIPGTPTTFVNGDNVAGIAGATIGEVESAYDRLLAAVTPVLDEPTDVAVELAANVVDGKLHLTAEAFGFGDQNENLRMRVAIAEAEVDFRAPNKIRRHEMVVRWMPGGAEGVAVDENGKLRLDATLDPAELQRQLAEYLAAFEESQGFEFGVKPMPKGPFHVVAFVQDDETRDVLQATAVEIVGELGFEGGTAKPNEGNDTPGEDAKQPDAEAGDDPPASEKPDADSDR